MIVALSSFKSKLSTLTFVLDSSSSRFRLDCRFFSSFFPIPRCLGVVLVPYIILFSKADFLSSNLINRTRVSSLKPSKAILQWSFNLLSISLSRDVRSYWFNIIICWICMFCLSQPMSASIEQLPFSCNCIPLLSSIIFCEAVSW